MGTFGATFQPGRDDDPRARALHDDDPVQQAIQILAMRLPSAQGESSLLPDELLGHGRSDWQRYFERRRAAQLAPHFRGATAGTNDKPASSAVVNNVLNAARRRAATPQP